ncbi:hypothetical protein PFISCL1PPCAC_25028, partial [Pristionchus fissidentatus]
GGYFDYQDNCREMCANNYGLRTCLGYAYEPDNRGKCTLFQYDITGYTTDPSSTARVVIKC